jgi:hypothetical protein
MSQQETSAVYAEPPVGYYDIGGVVLSLTRKPSLFARLMCRWLLGWRWIAARGQDEHEEDAVNHSLVHMSGTAECGLLSCSPWSCGEDDWEFCQELRQWLLAGEETMRAMTDDQRASSRQEC